MRNLKLLISAIVLFLSVNTYGQTIVHKKKVKIQDSLIVNGNIKTTGTLSGTSASFNSVTTKGMTLDVTGPPIVKFLPNVDVAAQLLLGDPLLSWADVSVHSNTFNFYDNANNRAFLVDAVNSDVIVDDATLTFIEGAHRSVISHGGQTGDIALSLPSSSGALALASQIPSLSGYLLNTTDSFLGTLTIRAPETPAMLVLRDSNDSGVFVRAYMSFTGLNNVEQGHVGFTDSADSKLYLHGLDGVEIQDAFFVDTTDDIKIGDVSGAGNGLSIHIDNANDVIDIAGDLDVKGSVLTKYNNIQTATQTVTVISAGSNVIHCEPASANMSLILDASVDHANIIQIISSSSSYNVTVLSTTAVTIVNSGASNSIYGGYYNMITLLKVADNEWVMTGGQ